MDSYFHEAFEGLQAAAQHLMQASQEIHQAGAAIVKVTTAALQARTEHDDLRETVQTTQGLVMELLDRVKRLEGNSNGSRKEVK